MDITFYDLNLYAILLMVVLAIVVRINYDSQIYRGRIFMILILAQVWMLALELFSWVFDGLSGDAAYFFNFLFNVLFSMFSTVVVSIWVVYIDFLIHSDMNRIKRLGWWYFSPTIIAIIINVINLFTPILFTINSQNEYQRQPLVWIFTIMSFFLYIYTLVLVIKSRKIITNKAILAVILFLIFPMIAAYFQLSNLGVTIIWAASALATVFTYLLLETTSSTVDYLTGIHRRVRAEDFMRVMKRRQKPFTVFMIDMDDFKQLNDTLGHHAGDQALVEMARIIKSVFQRKDAVTRYGGDEFLIVKAGDDKQEAERCRDKILQRMQKSTNDYIKQGKFSLGVSYCRENDTCSIDQLLVTADNDMYVDKAKNKNYKRRKSDR